MLNNNNSDIIIIGGGMVGMSLAWQLLERHPDCSITIIEKEETIGVHGSGRNSGILHAGIYYEPGSIKAELCVNGAQRLRRWCEDQSIKVLKCGKVITPQKPELDKQLDLLKSRGMANGATVELIDRRQFNELVPDGYTSTGRALWSPNTCVVQPKVVVSHLMEQLKRRGVKFEFKQELTGAHPKNKVVLLNNKNQFSYGHLFNCAGLHSDEVAHQYGIGLRYTMLPFRGEYYQLRRDAPFKFNTNLYPVPDLNFPFLGVHVTPSVDGAIYLGPTATPALGRENYIGLTGINVAMAVKFLMHMTQQAIVDKKMRFYISQQALEFLPSKFINAARSIVPKLELKHVQRSAKVGIRPQLYDKKSMRLIQDFVMLPGQASTHIINAISPAFTASFALADYIIDNSEFSEGGA